MKKSLMLGLVGMLLVSTSADMINTSGQAGEDYISLGFGIGTGTTGLAASGNWVYNDGDGDVARPGLGPNTPLGPLMVTADDKGVYTSLNDGDEGYAVAVGGGLQQPIGDSLCLFGEYYYFPDSLSSGIDSYEETNIGARLAIIHPLNIEAGYRYLNLTGKNGNCDNAIADGSYVEVNTSF